MLKIKMYLFSLLIVFFSPSGLCFDLESIEWVNLNKKSNSDQDIRVYIPKDFKHSSGLVPIKFSAIFNHGIARVLTGLANEKTKLMWVPKLREIKMIDKKSASKFISYYRYDAPWPFEDRDFVIINEGRIGSGPQDKTVFVEVKSVIHKSAPVVDGVTRGTTFAGYSKITDLGKNRTRVEMALLTDFGGHIPNWIINMVQKKWPYNFVKNYTKFLDENEFKINPAYIRQK